MRVSILTLGCKVNQYESECIAEALSEKGFTVVPFEEEAEVCIINTCTVTGESDRKSCQMIRRAANRIPKPFVAVLGCMSQTQPDRAGRIPGVDYVCGTRNKLSCVDRICRFAETGEFPGTPEIRVPCADELPFERMRSNHSERTRAYLKIEDGCANRCSYCSIRLARGGVVSRDPEDVLAEMRRLTDAGYRELVFTGIEIASYGIDFRERRPAYRLIDLLETADAQADGIRIRLGSLEPAYLKPEVVGRLAALKHLAPHFHLSVQSASDDVLRRMRRKYTAETVRTVLRGIREAVPEAQFTTDLMTGFPGETEEMFLQTLSFVRESRFLHCHVFPYSRRKHTEADEMDGQLSGAEKNERARRLIAAAEETEAEVYRSEAERLPVREILTEERLPDGEVTGHTASYLEVRVADSEGLLPLHAFCPVRITGAERTNLRGVPVRPDAPDGKS